MLPQRQFSPEGVLGRGASCRKRGARADGTAMRAVAARRLPRARYVYVYLPLARPSAPPHSPCCAVSASEDTQSPHTGSRVRRAPHGRAGARDPRRSLPLFACPFNRAVARASGSLQALWRARALRLAGATTYPGVRARRARRALRLRRAHGLRRAPPGERLDRHGSRHASQGAADHHRADHAAVRRRAAPPPAAAPAPRRVPPPGRHDGGTNFLPAGTTRSRIAFIR